MNSQSDIPQIPTSLETSESTNTVSKKINRRGRGSREKAAEKYRTHKNLTKGKAMIDARIAAFHLEHGYDPDEVFGTIAVESQTKPTQPVIITTHLAPAIARETVYTLIRSCKVPSQDIETDVETVQLATSLQISAKLYYAQRNSPFAQVNAENETLAKRVVTNIPQCIQPLAVYVDQIGQCEVNNQTFVPMERVVDGELRSFSYTNLGALELFNRDQYGFIGEEALDHNGIRVNDFDQLIPVLNPQGQNILGMHGLVYIRVHDAQNRDMYRQMVLEQNVPNFIPPDQGEFVFLRHAVILPPPDVIFARYIEFMSRVRQRLSIEKLPFIDLEKGQGTVAQIVGYGPPVQELVQVSCSRVIPDVCFYIGGAFEFGRARQPLHDPVVAVTTCLVDLRQAIHRLVAQLTGRKPRTDR